MALYKRENVPEIPMSPSLPDLPSKKDLPELPSFPSGNRNKNLNQEIVKSAITDNLSGENEVRMNSPDEELGKINLPALPTFSYASKEIPTQRGMVSIMDSKPEQNFPKAQVINKVAIKNDSIEPIFVRIDRFQVAKKSLEQIRRKIDEMESSIEKLNQVKVKEEEEIKSWSSEISNLKMRLAEIDSNIFDQI